MPISPAQAEAVAAEVARIYAEAEQQVLRKIANRVARGIDEEGYYERKLAELQALRGEVEAEIRRLQRAEREVERIVADAYEKGSESAIVDLRRVARAETLRTAFTAANQRAIQALVQTAIGNLRATHLRILRQAEDVYRQVIAETAAPQVLTGALTRREAAQLALNRFADMGITGFVDRAGRTWTIESYAEMATRTAAGQAAVQGHIDRLIENDRDLVIVSDAPEECPLCVVPGTIIEGPMPTWRCRLEYAGDVISITTATGKHLTATPDHTVLTDKGWRRLKELRPGDKVVSDYRQQGYAGVVPDHIQVPTPVEEVGKLVAPLLLASPTRREFDGDVAYREVKVVWPDGFLLDELDAAFLEPFGDFGFVGRLGLYGFGAVLGYGLLCLLGVGGTAPRFIGEPDNLLPLLWGHLGIADFQALAGQFRTLLWRQGSHVGDNASMPWPSFDTGTSQVVADYPTADAEGGAELLRALAGQVTFDEIRSLGVRKFAGHVWDLQTTPGWYASNGIISHNCRPWEGKILSLTGRTPGYPTVDQARAAGLWHPMCRHTIGAYIPGLTELPNRRELRDPSGYEERVKQRYMERQIRKWKLREAVALDDEARRQARAKVREWQARIRQFVAEHDRKRLYYREQVGKAR